MKCFLNTIASDFANKQNVTLMAKSPVVTGISPKEGPPGTKVTIRGEYLGNNHNDLLSNVL